MPTVNDPDGQPMRVSGEGFASTFSIVLPQEAQSGDEGDCYSVVIEVDTGAVTCDFFYLKNTSSKILRIYHIKAKSQTADTEVQIKTAVSGVPTGGSSVVPINALVGSGDLAEVVCEQRVTGDMDLTGGDIYDRLFLDAAVIGEQQYRYSGEIALLKNQALVFHAPADTGGNVNMTVYFYFHDKV